ncbi:hypothetical protein Pan97_21590 [Bremerella volcania]|uniref:(5-formylfuran-3-yl)methyl phosphate synthase n=1 Tax=Bremerella volcania TaxID=2527984 RepID=A0A518C7C6_9BACT|nr:(5-formylfuran-3-yl)methyl phosphate synthase [Bremerella volcania]QDU75136.1 hypothetical protein Pan97_21590 [Bremerella volcania]
MQLLVSVRSVAEANLAGQLSVDLIDLKEPNSGSLGATSPKVWQAVACQWHQRTRVSLALGELPEVVSVANVPAEADSVKIGLAGCRRQPDWQSELSTLFDQLPNGVQRVAVYYADAHLADSPSLEDVLDMARQLECQTFLVDTYDKSAGAVFDHMSPMQLKKLRDRLHADGLHFALAGSLRVKHLSSVAKIQPDIVAVRGAVCHRDRTGEIDAELLQSFREQLRLAWKLDRQEVLSRS